MWQRVNANFDYEEAEVAIDIFGKARRETVLLRHYAMAKVKLGPELDWGSVFSSLLGAQNVLPLRRHFFFEDVGFIQASKHLIFPG